MVKRLRKNLPSRRRGIESELGSLEALLYECEQSPEDVKTIAEEVKKAKDPNSKKKSLTVEKNWRRNVRRGIHVWQHRFESCALLVMKRSRLLQTRKEVKKTSKTAQKRKKEKRTTPKWSLRRLERKLQSQNAWRSYSRTSSRQRGKTSRTASSRSTASPFARAHTINYSSKRGNLSIFAKFLKTKTRPCGQKISSTSYLARETCIDLENFNLHDCKEAFQYFCKLPWL